MGSENLKILPSSKSVDPDVILEKAKGWGLSEVLIIGWDENGEFTLGGSHTKASDIAWLLDNAKHWLMNQD